MNINKPITAIIAGALVGLVLLCLKFSFTGNAPRMLNENSENRTKANFSIVETQAGPRENSSAKDEVNYDYTGDRFQIWKPDDLSQIDPGDYSQRLTIETAVEILFQADPNEALDLVASFPEVGVFSAAHLKLGALTGAVGMDPFSYARRFQTEKARNAFFSGWGQAAVVGDVSRTFGALANSEMKDSNISNIAGIAILHGKGKAVIDEIGKRFSGGRRRNLLMNAFRNLAISTPKTALKELENFSSVDFGDELAKSLFLGWTSKDLGAVEKWIKDNDSNQYVAIAEEVVSKRRDFNQKTTIELPVFDLPDPQRADETLMVR